MATKSAVASKPIVLIAHAARGAVAALLATSLAIAGILMFALCETASFETRGDPQLWPPIAGTWVRLFTRHGLGLTWLFGGLPVAAWVSSIRFDAIRRHYALVLLAIALAFLPPALLAVIGVLQLRSQL